MKLRSLFFAASVAALLAGCAKDDNLVEGPDNPQPLPPGTTGTMNVSLKYAVETRAAGDFEDGDPAEGKATDLTIYYFDGSKNYLGKGEAPDLNQTPDGDAGNGIESTIIAVSVPAGVVSALHGNQNATNYAVAVLNGKNSFKPDESKIKTFADFNAAINTAITDAAKADNFLMTSSNYITDVSGKQTEMALTPITYKNIGISGNTNKVPEEEVKIAIERVVAKVLVQSKDNADLGILGWGLNVTNKKFFPVKSFGTTGFLDELETGKKYANWKPNTSGADAPWNDPANKRSHWAVDPNYNDENGDDNFTTYSFTTPYKEGPQYCFENTMIETSQFRDKSTSAVIVAQFYPDGITSGTWIKWKGLGYTTNDFVTQVINNTDLSQYTKDGSTELSASDFEFVYKGSENEANKIVFGDKQATVIGYKNATATVVLKSGINLDNSKTKEEVDAAVAATIATSKPDVYYEGYCYYLVPIRHFDEGEVAAYDPATGYTANTLGRYGVVRNNYYVITVNSITTAGKPVTDPDVDPDTDPDDNTQYFINVDIDVLSWKIRNQGVDL